MLAAIYKAAIDACFAVDARLAGPFAPHQVYSGSPQPDLAVELDAGYIWNGTTLTEKAAQTVGGFTIPSAGQHRIDRVVVDATTGVASRVAGTAVTGSPSAVAPAIPAGKIPNCQILITSADTAVLDSMITDERAYPTSAGGGITLGTEQASTSGTSKDFTGIPSTAKRVTISFREFSTNGTSVPIVQLGTSGSPETTGYKGAGSAFSGSTTYTSGFGFVNSGSNAAYLYNGTLTLTLEDASDNTWACSADMAESGGTFVTSIAGTKALAGVLDMVRITTVGGTDTMDSGAINITYE